MSKHQPEGSRDNGPSSIVPKQDYGLLLKRELFKDLFLYERQMNIEKERQRGIPLKWSQ